MKEKEKLTPKERIEVRDELEAFLGRLANPGEIINAENDPNMVMKIILPRLREVERIIKILIDKKVV